MSNQHNSSHSTDASSQNSSLKNSTKSTLNSTIDKPTKVRETEALNAKAVTDWLISQNIDIQGNPEVTQFSGGASNWTYCLQYDNRDLILRRPPAGTKAKSAHDMVREFNIQQALKGDYSYVPEMIALCTDESVLGCDFYVMERLVGIIPRANLPKQLKLERSQIHTLCTNVIDALIELHQVDYQHNAQLNAIGKGDGYCERQLAGWERRYKKAKTPNVPSFSIVSQWLKRNLPEDNRICVIHNDWRFDNVVLDPENPTSVIGVLDWEMATLGDPLMDLGGALAYWVQRDDNFIMRQSRRQPTHLDGMMTRQQVVDYYLEKTGMTTDNWAFYEVFGLFRLAGIAQQIYYRYYNKQTDNPAFKNFWIITHAINARALKVITKQEAKKVVNSGKLPKPITSIAKRWLR